MANLLSTRVVNGYQLSKCWKPLIPNKADIELIIGFGRNSNIVVWIWIGSMNVPAQGSRSKMITFNY